MKRTNIYLTESQCAKLAALSDGRPMAEIIRRAIDEYLTRNAPKETAKETEKRPRMKWDERGNVIE